MLSVIGYNIHYGGNIDKLKDWFAARRNVFDIICLQEFPLEEISVFLNQIKAFTFDYSFSPSFLKKKKQYGQLTVFNTKKLQLTGNTILSLGPSLLERSKKRGERSALITHFNYKNKHIVVVNTHLVCFALNKRRITQLKRILAYFHTLSQKDAPILLLGDLNYSSLIRQKILLTFMEKHNFINAYKTATFKKLFLRYQLDYLFYKNCKVSDVRVAKLKYSDHYPIEFMLEI